MGLLGNLGMLAPRAEMTFSPQTVMCSGLRTPSNNMFPSDDGDGDDDDDDNLQLGKDSIPARHLTYTDVNPESPER